MKTSNYTLRKRKASKFLQSAMKVDGGAATVSVQNIAENLGHYIDAVNVGRLGARNFIADRMHACLSANPTLIRAVKRESSPARRGVPGGPQDIWTAPVAK